MNKNHDAIYLEVMQQVLDRGIWKQNRTGVKTKSIFGVQMRFDLRDGTIPLLTTKRMHTRAIIHELLWNLMGTGNIKYLQDNNVTIWDEWNNPNLDLGPVYGEMWRNWPTREIVFIDPKIIPYSAPKIPPIHSQLQIDNPNNLEFIGEEFSTNESGLLRVISLTQLDKKGDHKYKIQFTSTGYIKDNVRKSVIKRGNIIDVYAPRVLGVGYLGEYDKTDIHKKQLKIHWHKMLERCYDKSLCEYTLYGGAGIFVHPDWHNFAIFQQDVKNIKGWCDKQKNPEYQLDKDYYSSNCYSKETCVWLSPSDNTLYRHNPRPFKYTLPNNNNKLELSVSNILDKLQLKRSCVHRALNTNKLYKKIKFEWVDVPVGKVARINRYIDQIERLVDTLKNNPNDRRMIVSAWNPTFLPLDDVPLSDHAYLGKQVLPPCHMLFQCYVANGELSLILTQRSCDLFLGVPFNIVQYSLLLRMLAHVTKLKPGELIWNGGDVHIYENHVEQCLEQLTRKPFSSPTFYFNRDIDDIDDFKFEDFVVENYIHHPTIKADVAV